MTVFPVLKLAAETCKTASFLSIFFFFVRAISALSEHSEFLNVLCLALSALAAQCDIHINLS